MGKGASSEKVVREIHRRTRRRFSAEEKIRIILEGLRGARRASRSCAGARGWRRTCISGGGRSFLEAGKSGCSATRRGRQRRQK